jgi:hypothetical protein
MDNLGQLAKLIPSERFVYCLRGCTAHGALKSFHRLTKEWTLSQDLQPNFALSGPPTSCTRMEMHSLRMATVANGVQAPKAYLLV